ncbi:hypothetical protein DL93DRAFT_2163235 [Clavulina sp. PMI_390]|nr:hypothetical protein DL93DRAFT_2163235 [Clavulina sp. PMI_390]
MKEEREVMQYVNSQIQPLLDSLKLPVPSPPEDPSHLVSLLEVALVIGIGHDDEKCCNLYNNTNLGRTAGNLTNILTKFCPSKHTPNNSAVMSSTWTRTLQALALFTKLAASASKRPRTSEFYAAMPLIWDGKELELLKTLSASQLLELADEGADLEQLATDRRNILDILESLALDILKPAQQKEAERFHSGPSGTYKMTFPRLSNKDARSVIHEVLILMARLRSTCICESTRYWNERVASLMCRCADVLNRILNRPGVSHLGSFMATGSSASTELSARSILSDAIERLRLASYTPLEEAREYILISTLLAIPQEKNDDHDLGTMLASSELVTKSTSFFRRWREEPLPLTDADKNDIFAKDPAADFWLWSHSIIEIWRQVAEVAFRFGLRELLQEVLHTRAIFLLEWRTSLVPVPGLDEGNGHSDFEDRVAAIKEEVSVFVKVLLRLTSKVGTSVQWKDIMAQLITVLNRSKMSYSPPAIKEVWDASQVKITPALASNDATCRGPLCEIEGKPKLMCGRCDTPYCSAECQGK